MITKWSEQEKMDDNNPRQPAVFPLTKVARAPKPDVQDSILAQVARQLESEKKWAQVDKMPIQGIKLWVIIDVTVS